MATSRPRARVDVRRFASRVPAKDEARGHSHESHHVGPNQGGATPGSGPGTLERMVHDRPGSEFLASRPTAKADVQLPPKSVALMPNASRTARTQPACGDMSAWGASRPRCSSRAVRNARGRWDSCRRGPSRKLTLPMIADPGHHVAITFGSKFRAITRAITHGQSGVITVNRGWSRERTPVPVKRKHAGHRPMTCCFSGGQGRGRTADLPIFSRSSKPVFANGSRRTRRPAAQ